jgi:diguanylate cyclase (GGDEF)-like protein
LLPTVDPATAMKIGRDLIRVLSEPMTVEYLGVVEIGASIGAAHYPQDADTLKGLMVAADTAMYQAKASGRGCVVNYKKAMTP